MCRAAMKRGVSVFLPTATYPMFPEKLAMEGMSLKQGEICQAVTVSVVLHSDGRYELNLLVHPSNPDPHPFLSAKLFSNKIKLWYVIRLLEFVPSIMVLRLPTSYKL